MSAGRKIASHKKIPTQVGLSGIAGNKCNGYTYDHVFWTYHQRSQIMYWGLYYYLLLVYLVYLVELSLVAVQQGSQLSFEARQGRCCDDIVREAVPVIHHPISEEALLQLGSAVLFLQLQGMAS